MKPACRSVLASSSSISFRHSTTSCSIRRADKDLSSSSSAAWEQCQPHRDEPRQLYKFSPSDGTSATDGSDKNDTSEGGHSNGALPPLPPPDKEAPSDGKKKTKKNHLKFQKSPLQVVKELDRHIVGQADAKRAVAIALRNRWRRQQLSPELQKEVTPRNVLMIGPTGCGKTEVARRMADLGGAPFLKVEATKFTEVGYHGGDVDKIIRDLVEVSLMLTKKQKKEALKEEVTPKVEERLLNLLTGQRKGAAGNQDSRARDSFRAMLREGMLEEVRVEFDVPSARPPSSDSSSTSMMSGGKELSPEDVERLNAVVAVLSLVPANPPRGGGGDGGSGSSGNKANRQSMPIREARDILFTTEIDKALEGADLKKEAIRAVEESGIVFLDEIDKICTSRDTPRSSSSDASDEGVQRDLLPLVEGTTISTKHGNVNTDFILFIASGAFHSVKPSDMLPELQGRLPIRVNLAGLSEHDLYRILTEPVANVSASDKCIDSDC
jgi:ATP-dependent HslUV protease ATP-binding subunit HslU